MNRNVLRISRRAWLLAKQNQIDLSNITPTGPGGRIIERDIFREIEKNQLVKNQETSVEELQMNLESVLPEQNEIAKSVEETPVEEPAEAEEVAEEPTEESVEETPVEEPVEAEEIAEEPTEESVEETPVEAEEIAEEPTEESVEETPVEETAEAEEIAEEPTEESVEEIPVEESVEAEEPEIEIELIEMQEEQTAIIPVSSKAIANEVHAKDDKAEEMKSEKEKSDSYGTEAYRHTDVIIPRTESSPNGMPITLTMSFDAGAIVKLNHLVKENGEAMGLPHITINDMILFATARLLKKNKALNAHFLGDKIRYFEGAHLGFSVDTDHGIETLTVFDADRLSLYSLAKITAALIRGARAGNISPEKNKLCASFMVSNLGTLGVESFTPVLKEPQTGVLGVCALQRRIKEVNGKDVTYSCIPLSLTFDPRALDTTSAVKFLRELCVSLENFELLLIK